MTIKPLNLVQFAEPPFSDQQRRRKRVHLAIAMAPLVGSVAFNWGLRIPGLGCPLMRYVGVPCPGWGMTRSFMAVARGDWGQAIAFNAFGPILFLGFVIAALHIAWELLKDRPLRTFYVPIAASPKFQVFCFLMLVGYHSVRLRSLWQSGELTITLHQAPLGYWVLKAAEWLTSFG